MQSATARPPFGLIALGLVPVAALTALLVWSDQVADEHESRESVQAEPFRPPAEPNPALVTSMLDYRRTPSELASVGADNELSDVLDQLAAFIDARSCLAVSVDGRTVTSWNGDVAVIPAARRKLLIAGAAVEVLGADHRFVTSVAAPPPIEGVIDGDLHLVGGGDPVLVAADFPLGDDAPAAATTLETLADAVVAAGVDTITGAVVGDASRYDDEFVNPAWDDAVAYVDAGPIGAWWSTTAVWSAGRDANEIRARQPLANSPGCCVTEGSVLPGGRRPASSGRAFQ